MSDLKDHLNSLRNDFSKSTLSEREADKDPVKQFEKWMSEAVSSNVNEPHAMTLSTVDRHNKPSSRVVFLRHFSDSGFVFYTNYNSKKGRDIEQNPFACLNFFWPELERQIRIEGKMIKQTDKESDFYFASRPRASQLGAWISLQSELLASREELDTKYAELEKKYEGKEIPRPPFWGGFNLVPESFEFWQGRPSRLHDRIKYSIEFENWAIARLFP